MGASSLMMVGVMPISKDADEVGIISALVGKTVNVVKCGIKQYLGPCQRGYCYEAMVSSSVTAAQCSMTGYHGHLWQDHS
ncbi:hypothetical protein BDV11DRAFT_196803, partial [Aspergillus similis]